MLKKVGSKNDIVIINLEDFQIQTTQDALDLMATMRYEAGCEKLILKEHHLVDRFFDLKSGLAGDILQKFVNYQIKLAVIGNFERYSSKALHDFIYECNKGKHLFFVSSETSAVQMLENA